MLGKVFDPASSETSSPDFYARATWDGQNFTAVSDLWQRYVALSPTINCPKVGVAHFYYPSLGTSIRGAKALQPISRKERICKVPVLSMLSIFTVRNSTLAPVLKAAEKTLGSQLEEKSAIILLLMRERERIRSTLMPYARLIETHDVSGIPMLWAPHSHKWANTSARLRMTSLDIRRKALEQYKLVVQPALRSYPYHLSEGLECARELSLSQLSRVCSHALLEKMYSEETFLRWWAIISARDWVLDMYGENHAFLAPVVDMMNFGQVGIRAEFDSAEHAFVVTATQPIAEGEELLFYYGSICIDQWIRIYGFSPPNARKCPLAHNQRKGTRMPSTRAASSPLPVSGAHSKKSMYARYAPRHAP
jgi:hypothetical protein